MRMKQLAVMGCRLSDVPVINSELLPDWLRWHEINQERAGLALADKRLNTALNLGSDEYFAYRDHMHKRLVQIQENGSQITCQGVAAKLRQLLGESLSKDTFIPDQFDFRASYADIIVQYGVLLLDMLCHSEVDGFIYALNQHLSGHECIVGPGYGRFSARVRGGGMFGYACSADLLCDGEQVGVLAWGAANFGCLVSFSGAGCAALDFPALHRVLADLPGAKITRVDVALDDYSGRVFDVELARTWAMDGRFTKRRPPKYHYFESGELIPSAAAKLLGRQCHLVATGGKSLYIGSRDSGLMCRFYEKGKQLQSEDHPNWVRAEVEIRNQDRVVPFDVLLNPDQYFAGAYPCLGPLVDAVPVVVETTKGKMWSVLTQAWIAKVKASRARVVETAAVQCGRVVNFLRHVEQRSPAEIVDMFTGHLSPEDKPHRLRIPLPDEFVRSDHEYQYGGMVTI